MNAKIKPRIDLQKRTKLEEVIPLGSPFVIFVDPSDRCNFECKFCPTGNKQLMKEVGRPLKAMKFDLFKKIIDDIREFDQPIKVLRLYKDGEPLLNTRFVDMIKCAKDNPKILSVDTTTNASLLNPKRNLEIIKAGLDRMNISIEGMSNKQYKKFSNYKINFDKYVKNIQNLYENRKQCEVIIKINGDVISEDDKKLFYEIFHDKADGIFVEHIMSCWPEFKLDGVQANKELGVYGQEIKEVITCPYVFYSFSINSDGFASLCFLDWSRKLLIGDINEESVKNIWNGRKLHEYQKMFLMKRRKEHPICRKCGQMTHGLPDDIDKHAEMLLNRISSQEKLHETYRSN
jgi:radical SAM protein with 4Fe4S-binding SPASM domain